MPNQTLNVIEDAHENITGSSFNDTNSIVRMDDHATVNGARFRGGFYFELTSAIPDGATIDTCYITLDPDSTGADDVNGDLDFEDSADCDDFTTTAEISTRTLTGNNVNWTQDGLGASPVNSPSLVTPMQDLIDTHEGLASGAGVMVIFTPKSNATKTFRVNSEDSGDDPADLYIEWTESGGTTYNQSTAGSLSTSGAVGKKTAVTYTGSLSFIGAVVLKILSNLVGTLSTSGVLVNKLTRALAGVLSSSGAISRNTQKISSGTVSFLGGLSEGVFKVLSGVLSLGGTLSQQIVFTQSIAGVLSFGGSLVNKTQKLVDGSLSFTGSVIRKIQYNLVGAISFSGDLIKGAALSVTGVLSSIGTSSQKIVFTTSISGAISFAGGLVQKVGKSLGGVLSLPGTLVSFASKAISGILSLSGIANYKIPVTLQGSLSFVGGLALKTKKILVGAISFAGSLATELQAGVGVVTSRVLTLFKRTNILTMRKRTNILNLKDRD